MVGFEGKIEVLKIFVYHFFLCLVGEFFTVSFKFFAISFKVFHISTSSHFAVSKAVSRPVSRAVSVHIIIL